LDRSRLTREAGETLRLALPLMAGQLSAIGMNVVDVMLAGHLDAHTLGAVAVGSSVWSLALVAGIGVMLALPPSVAQLAGADRRGAIAPLYRQALWLALCLGLVLLLLVRTLGPRLVELIGVDPALHHDTRGFLHGIAWGAPALAVYFASRGLSEGMALTRPTMYFGMFGLALLAPIGWVLMYGKFGFAARGAAGSGEATAIVLWLQALALIAWLRWRPEYRALGLFAHFEAPRWRAIADLLRVGLPMGVTLFMEASLFVAVALAIGRLGEATVAGHQIALNVASVTLMLPLGLAMAITVRVGHAVGRGDRAAVRWAGHTGIVLTLATQLVASLVMLSFPQMLAALYTHDETVAALAAQLLVLAGLFQFSDGIQVAANGALRGLKDTRLPMLITCLAYWGIGMSSGWWLAFRAGYGARGMWMGLIAGLSTAALLLFWRFWAKTRDS
jgi:MATE family multidrug resistance protein